MKYSEELHGEESCVQLDEQMEKSASFPCEVLGAS